MKRFAYSALVALLCCLGLMTMAPQAQAATAGGSTTNYPSQCSQSTAGDQTTQTCVSGSAHSTASDQGVDVARLKAHGRVVGEYLISGGLTKQDVGTAKCYTSHNGTNTIRESDGQLSQYHDTRPQKICHTGNGPWGWQVVKCGNFYHPGGHAPHVYRVVHNPVVVKSFANYTFHAAMRVKAVSQAHASASSSSVCTNSSGSGSGSGFAQSSASATLRFTFHGASQLTAAGEQVRQHYELSLNASGYAKAKAQATAQASAASSCTSVTPPPSVTPPSVNASANGCVGPQNPTSTVTVSFASSNSGDNSATVSLSGQSSKTVALNGGQGSATFQVSSSGTYNGSVTVSPSGQSTPFTVSVAKCDTPAPSKPTVSATTLNDLYQGEYSNNWCIQVNLPNGDAGKVTFGTIYGTIRNGIGGAILNSYAVSGTNRYCFTYYAPNDPGTTTNLTEKVTVDLVDTVTNVTADTYKVPDFTIKPSAAGTHPARSAR